MPTEQSRWRFHVEIDSEHLEEVGSCTSNECPVPEKLNFKGEVELKCFGKDDMGAWQMLKETEGRVAGRQHGDLY